MGLACQKCLTGVYNLCLGYCHDCDKFGPLGMKCCMDQKYQKMTIKCLNPRYGTIYTCNDMTLNRYWYGEVQGSFDKNVRNMNQMVKWNAENNTKKCIALRNEKESLVYKHPKDVVKNLIEAYIDVTNNMFADELRGDPLYWSGRDLIPPKKYGHDSENK